MIAAKADLCINTDDLKRGETIVALAAELGAKTFVHYSFPRHMSYELLAQRRDIFREQCEGLGIKFVEVDAPDPTGDAGLTGAQQFILEDVPRQIDKYGEDTNFFSTNCGMQEPLIRSVLDGGAIYAEQCCPSKDRNLLLPGAIIAIFCYGCQPNIYPSLCQYLAGIFPRSRQINLKPPLTIAWDQPGTT